MPAVHSHHLHRRQAAGGTWKCLPQSGWNLDRSGLMTYPRGGIPFAFDPLAIATSLAMTEVHEDACSAMSRRLRFDLA